MLLRNHGTKGLKHTMSGFTIIELLIATLIFTTILLLLTFSVIAISQHYYKGVTQTETQTASRTIESTLSKLVEFGGSPTSSSTSSWQPYSSGNVSWFCISNQIFVYYGLGYQLVSGTPGIDQANYGLVQGTFSGSCPVPPSASVSFNSTGIVITTAGSPSSPTNQTELLGVHMRLSQLNFQSVGNLEDIVIQVTYGDNDLLCNTDASVGNICGSSLPVNPPASAFANTLSGQVVCRDQAGFQFCSYSLLNTVVGTRISSS